jgi:Glycosyl hydrolase family 57
MLTLFTVFHANLGFSSVPPGDVGRMLDQCLWPLVEATRAPGVALGLELPGDSLARIAAEDPLLLEAIRRAVTAGHLEIVGSGLVQAILPLVPVAVGAHNLRRGREQYRALLGAAPRVAYLHEQTYAAGLVPLYREAGYEALVAEWENPASRHAWPLEARYRAAWIEGTAGTRIACLWNSSVVFQRVQRYAHGELEREELVAHLLAHDDPATPRALCLYGNDCEVFDYRPGEAALRYGRAGRGEWGRVTALLEALGADPRVALATPSAILAAHPPREPALRLESAADPVPTKKQARYNVTRWALCGRANVRLNARCHALARGLDVSAALVRAGGGRVAVAEADVARLADQVARLWASDLRTHTTEARAGAADAEAGALAAELDALTVRLEAACVPAAPAPEEIVLLNPWPTPWAGWPLAFRRRWPPGCLRGRIRATAAGREVPVQLEEVETHRDGSLRAALVVVAPVIGPQATLRLRLASGGAVPALPAEVPSHLETMAVSATLAPRRGATLRDLAFPRLARGTLAGTVALGAFTPIELAADWYTGGFVLYDAAGEKHTDLEPTTLALAAPPEACPIRIPVVARLAGRYGELWKTVYVYREAARVDVRYHLALRDQRPRSLRLGTLTLDPEAFAPAALRYATVNGGREVETFPLGHIRVAQHEAVSPTVSARACLGATEGWVDVGDEAKGITVAWDPSVLAAAPLVQHDPDGERALTRVFLSLAESDETAAPFWRGHTTFTVSYLGRGAEAGEARRLGAAVARGLHVFGGEG